MRSVGVGTAPASPPKQVLQDGRQHTSHDRDQQHRDDRKVHANVSVIDPDVTGKAAEPRQSTGPHQDAQYRDEDSRRHEQEPYVTPNCASCPVIRPEPTRTLATIQPKMNPPTWAKNATPLPPVSDGWATA
jgi:hypothetical protein